MEFSIRRVNALFKKDIKDFRKNLNVLFMCLLPIVFTFVYSFMMGSEEVASEINQIEILQLVMGINFILVSSFVMATLIAEEKEKNTLRTLMLSSVSPFEFLLGKAMVILLLSILNNVIIYIVYGFEMQYFVMYLLLSTLVVVTMIVIGAIIGLIAQNQMATGVVGMPILMIFMLLPILAVFNKTLYNIALLFPNLNLQILLEKVLTAQQFNLLSKNMLVLIAWIIISTIIFAYTYNKKGLDK